MLFSSDKIPLCIYFIMCHIVMANLEWTRLHCPWDRRICFANRSDEGNQTNDAPISVTMMRLSLSLCLCARKMAHGSSLSAIKKNIQRVRVCAQCTLPQVWGHLILKPVEALFSPLAVLWHAFISVHCTASIWRFRSITFFTSCFRPRRQSKCAKNGMYTIR